MYSFSDVCALESLVGYRGIQLRVGTDGSSTVLLINQEKYPDAVATNHITYIGEGQVGDQSFDTNARNRQLQQYVRDFQTGGPRAAPTVARVYVKTVLDTCAAVTKEGRLCKNKCRYNFWMCGRHGGAADVHGRVQTDKMWVCAGDYYLTYCHYAPEPNHARTVCKFSLVRTPPPLPPPPIDPHTYLLQ
jgi:hypothetical protein